MAAVDSLKTLVHDLRRRCGDGPSDGDLLAEFAVNRDEAAFAALVTRHGRLVFGVARRHLADRHAAEDVVQTTFAALARQARRLGRPVSLVNWLYTVAIRQTRTIQRRSNRQACAAAQLSLPVPTRDPLAEVSGRELVTIIDDELERLPAVYRLPLLLCALEGLSREEAARRLGWPIGSVKGRLERGREILRTRLAKRGLTVPVVLAGGLLVQQAEAMPAGLVAIAIRAAMAVPAAGTSLKLVAGAGLAILALGVGTCLALMPGAEPQARSGPPPLAAAPVAPQPHVDAEGMPLPPEAIARLGSGRMRHGAGVISIAVSPDGKSIVAADPDAVTIWNAATGRRVWSTPMADPGTLWPGCTVRFAEDGHTVVCTKGGSNGTFRRLDATTGQATLQFEFKSASYPGDCISPDGRLFAYAHTDKSVRICDAATGREMRRLEKFNNVFRALDFAADNRMLAVADLSDTVYLFDTTTGEKSGQLSVPNARFNQVAIAPNGKSLAAVDVEERGTHRTAHLWDLTARRYIGALKGDHGERIFALQFSPDSKTLFSGNQFTDSALWNAQTGEDMQSFAGVPGVISAAFSADGKAIAAGTNGGVIVLWDVATRNRLPSSADPVSFVDNLCFVDDGRRILGRSDRLTLWDAGTGATIRRYPDLMSRGRTAVISPSGQLIAGSTDSTMRLWDASTGNEIRELTAGDEKTSSYIPPVFTPDGRRLIAAKDNRGIFWDVSSGKTAGSLQGTAFITGLTVSPDGRFIAGLSSDGWVGGDNSIRVWELANLKEISHFTFGRGTLMAAAFSPDGRLLFAVGGIRNPSQRSGEGQIWEIGSGKEVRSFAVPKSLIFSLAVSPDGRSFATGGGDGAVRVWETGTGTERYSFKGHLGYVESVAFSPDGKTLASSSLDAPVYVWDLYARSEGHSKPTSTELSRFWTDIAASDAKVAFESIRRLVNAPDATMALYSERLKPVPAIDTDRLKLLIQQLDAAKFADRQAAAKELEALVDRAVDQLQTALTETKSAEVRQSLKTILERLEAGTPETLRSSRAVEVLEQIGTPAARERLKVLAGGAPGATLTRAAADALKRLAK